MSDYAGVEHFSNKQRKIVTPVEPVDDIQYLRNFNVPDRDFVETVQIPKPQTAVRFVGAACRDAEK